MNERIKHTNIVRADINDVDEIITLMREHALFEQAHFCENNLKQKLINALQGGPPRLVVFLVKTASASVGYCALSAEFSSWKGDEYMHMDCLYIQKEMRGLHIGRRMIEAAITFCRNQGFKELQWQTPQWNENAIKFYQSVGATGLSKQRFTYPVN